MKGSPGQGPLGQAARGRHGQGGRRQIDSRARPGDEGSRARAAHDHLRSRLPGAHLARVSPRRTSASPRPSSSRTSTRSRSIRTRRCASTSCSSLKVKAMRDLLFRSKLFTYLAAATPGLRELVTIGKVWELTLDERKVKCGKAVRPRDRRRARHGPRRGLPPDAADIRERGARRPDRGAGRDAPQVHHQPPQDRRRHRRAARGDAGERDGDRSSGTSPGPSAWRWTTSS